MKAYPRLLAVLASLILAIVWWHSRTPEPTMLSFRPGQAFEGVVKDSTFPVLARSIIPDSDTGRGATWVTKRTVELVAIEDAFALHAGTGDP